MLAMEEWPDAHAAGAALGISYRTVARRVKEGHLRGLNAHTAVLSKEEKQRIEIAQLKRDLTAAQKEADKAERVAKELYDFGQRPVDPPKWLTPTRPAPSASKEVPCTIWSDWHYGETVRPEEVGGMNEYTAAIAAERIRRLVEDTIDICFNHMGRADKQPPGIVVMLGGDMITGDIHDELTATNDRTTMEAVYELRDHIAAGLTRMADAFGKVFVPCVVGNHGRSTKKPRMKGRVYTSFEWLLYKTLADWFSRDKRIQFLIPGESDAHFRVYNHRFLLTHGDSLGVKGGDGIIGALGPITRGQMKVARSEAQIGRDFDTLVIGHWHQDIYGPNDGVIVNNCLKGYDEFARLAMRAPFSVASQQLWWVHPTRGITAKRKVMVQDPPNIQEVREWLTWAA